MKNETTLLTMVQGLSPMEGVRIGTMTLGILVCIFAGRKTFVLAESITVLFFGFVSLIFSAWINLFVEGNLDVVHIYLVRMVSMLQIGVAAIRLVNRNSRNESVHSAGLITSFMVFSALSILQIQSFQKKSLPRFKDGQDMSMLLMDVLFMLGNFYHLWRSPTWWNNSTVKNSWINKLMLIDSVIIGYIGLSCLVGTPDVVSQGIGIERFKMDAMHGFFVHIFGVMFLSAALYGLFATQFIESEKKSLFWVKLLHNVLMLGVFTFHQWQDGIYRKEMFYFTCAVNAVLLAVRLCAVCQRKAKYN